MVMPMPKAPKPAPKPPVKELLQLSKRGEMKMSNFRQTLLSRKSKIFGKYGISGKEVDKFLQDAKKYGSHIKPQESRSLEKTLDQKRQYSQNIKEKVSSGKWAKILRDPKIFKK